MVGGLANIGGKKFMLIGHQKGRNTKERQFRNFGMAGPEGYRKALRLMKLAEKFNIPIVTFIDTPGAFPGIKAEEEKRTSRSYIQESYRIHKNKSSYSMHNNR